MNRQIDCLLEGWVCLEAEFNGHVVSYEEGPRSGGLWAEGEDADQAE
jgi:hypothetical protein